MDRQSLNDHLAELKSAPTNELNIRRFAEVTTAIKNFDMLETEKAMIELEQSEDAFLAYMRSKKAFCNTRSSEEEKNVLNALRTLLMNIEESIIEIWSLCECEAEKEIIKEYVEKLEKRIE